MSALNEVIVCLGALVLLGAGVLLWGFWPTPKRVERAAQAVQRHRRGETVVRVDPVEPVAVDGGDEERTEGEEPQAEPEPADPEVEQPSPDDPSWWALPPAASEPTPIFQASGQYPTPPDFESFTHGWNRTEILRAIRTEEARQAGVRAA